ncbi:MAG: transcriptional coactivator p15/PC4 family protein [Patescibacteria group bacterium]|nr:transcriptional coactivator p15/PC4 family protein [Candidatus Caldatribacteriota bacterium]MEA3296215.1 transcriptional coactivator p15/PC4 family protein [Patescibacteria group bacterium]
MKEIAQLDVTDNKRLILSVGEFRGVERVDLRQYVKVKEEFIPTPKGVNFSAEWIDDFVKMVDKLKEVD